MDGWFVVVDGMCGRCRSNYLVNQSSTQATRAPRDESVVVDGVDVVQQVRSFASQQSIAAGRRGVVVVVWHTQFN